MGLYATAVGLYAMSMGLYAMVLFSKIFIFEHLLTNMVCVHLLTKLKLNLNELPV